MPDAFAVAASRLHDARPEVARVAAWLREHTAQIRHPLSAAAQAAARQATGPAVTELARMLDLAGRASADRLDHVAHSLARSADGYQTADHSVARSTRLR